MEEVKSFLKSLWQNKRRRAVLSLVLWVIFFIIVFSLIGGPGTLPSEYYNSNGTQKNSGSSIDNFAKMENYEYNYLITIMENNNSNMYKIDGTYYNDKYYFEINGTNYYLSDNTIYIVDDTTKTLIEFNNTDKNHLLNILDLRLLTKTNIHTFMEASEEESRTTYKDGSTVKKLVYTSYDNRIIELVVSEYSNIISSIEIDFSKYFDKSYESFTVSATYKNINNIAEYNKSYDNYEIKKQGV